MAEALDLSRLPCPLSPELLLLTRLPDCPLDVHVDGALKVAHSR